MRATRVEIRNENYIFLKQICSQYNRNWIFLKQLKPVGYVSVLAREANCFFCMVLLSKREKIESLVPCGIRKNSQKVEFVCQETFQ